MRFEVLQILSSDRHAVVVMARERGTLEGRRVEIKVLRDDVYKPMLVARIRDEAMVLGRLRHPNIQSVFRLHTYEGRPALEMEYIPGLSVLQLLRQHRDGLPPAIAINIVRRTAHALQAAWNHPDGPGGEPMRIVHRTIKPANITVSTNGLVKVVNFTMAKGAYYDRIAQTQHAISAESYSGPEVHLGGAVTTAADIYSLGLVLYEMLTGRRMRLGSDTHEPAEMVARQIVRISSEVLQGLIRDMLSLRPEQRPSYEAIIAALEMAIEEGGYTLGLREFARDHVVTALEARILGPVQNHPDFRHVAFLERSEPDDPRRAALEPSPGDIKRHIRDLVNTPGWENHLSVISRYMQMIEHSFEEPFLRVLDRAHVPAWQFWRDPADPHELLAALTVLADSRSPAVLARAKALSAYAHPGVAQAAQLILNA